jgi:hypothetical protein
MVQFVWLQFYFQLVGPYTGLIEGYSVAQQNITFLVVPLKVVVSNSIPMPVLCLGKVVWDPMWHNFSYPSYVSVDVMNTKINYTTFRSQLACLPSPFLLLALTSQTEPISLEWWLFSVVSQPWQKASTPYVTVWYSNTSSQQTSCRLH